MPSLTLPDVDGALRAFTLSRPKGFPQRAAGRFNRVAYSAVHVVADPLSPVDPWIGCAIDWDTTIAYRKRLWELGLGVAEAMDTAQRGMGLDWPTSLELIRRSIDAARDHPGALVASGCGTDHLAPDPSLTVDTVIAAYESQIEAIEALGGRLILMASRALAACAKSPDDYGRVYDRLLSQVREPVIVHWLGDMFDPALAGYWGRADPMAAMDVAVDILNRNAARVDGVKISLLDKDKEIAMRRRLAPGIRMYTGDDFNFAELIAGDAQGHLGRAAGHLRRDRTRCVGGARRAGRRRQGGLPRDPRADRAAVAPHLRRADPLLQDRRGVHGLAERPPGSLRDGRRPAVDAQRAAPVGAVAARRWRRAARRP